MCLQCLDILNTKGLEAEAQSLIYRRRLLIVVEGISVRMWRDSHFQLMLEYKSYNICSLFILGSNNRSLQRASATLKASNMRALHSHQLNAKFEQVWPCFYVEISVWSIGLGWQNVWDKIIFDNKKETGLSRMSTQTRLCFVGKKGQSCKRNGNVFGWFTLRCPKNISKHKRCNDDDLQMYITRRKGPFHS